MKSGMEKMRCLYGGINVSANLENLKTASHDQGCLMEALFPSSPQTNNCAESTPVISCPSPLVK